MLTIAFVTSSLTVLAAALPSPITNYERGLKVPLSKRSALSLDSIVDADALLAALLRVES